MNIQREAAPQIVADVWLYETADGGRAGPVTPGWGCPVMLSTEEPFDGFDALLLLRDQDLRPGESRRLGFVFLSPGTAVPAIERNGRFYLWEGRFIGEAVVATNVG